MATKPAAEEKLDDMIRFRAPKSLRPRLKAIAHKKRRKYQAEAREIIQNFVDQEEEREKEGQSARKAKAS